MPATNTIVLRLLLAIVIGGIIGAEREYRNKSAGFRTMIMIALGSCLFTIFSVYIGFPGNQDRIASNIVTGIGFLGAGIIFKTDDRVRGLTTAATIWFTAALGMGIGSGLYAAAFAGCGMGMLILVLFTLAENRIDKLHEVRAYRITCDFKSGQMARFEAIFRSHHLKFKCEKQERRGQDFACTWKITGKTKNHHKLADELLNDVAVKDVEFIGR